MLQSVHDAITAYGDNPSAFLALNEGNDFFAAPGLDGVVAYRRAGRYLVQFAGPFAPPSDYVPLLRGFLEFAAARRKRVIAVQLQRADATVYADNGFTVNQLGASYAVELSRFSLRGGHFMRLRNKISRARRTGLVVDEVAPTECAEALSEVDKDWLRGKGRHVKELRFLIGERTGRLERYRRLFAGHIDGTLVAYISYSPVGGGRPGWLHDLSRRRHDAPPGIMETINLTAIERFQAEGVQWLHFGFTPFTGLDPGLEMHSSSRMMSRVARLLATHGEAIYPARTQLAYKEKWQPHAVLPEYLAFHGRPSAGAIWRLLRLANVI